MTELQIPVSSPAIGNRETELVLECLRSGWIGSLGEHVTRFEEAFARYCGAKYGVATTSGTAALHLALAALGVGPGDDVLLPTFTMIATPNSVTYVGAKIALIDSELETWNMDVTAVRGKLTDKTKAIIPVHTYGHPVDMKPLMDLAEERGLYVVEDAAEAHGAEYRDNRVGGIGTMGCFSFYANKIITTGEGGMIVTNDEELAEKARWLRGHAFGPLGKHYWHERIGFNYRMTALQGALGLAQLERIDEYVRHRRECAAIYNSLLKDVKGLTLPPEAPWAKNVYWMYSALVEEDFPVSRDGLMLELEKKGIETRTFFYPVHVQPCYHDSLGEAECPRAEVLSKKGVNLPSGNALTEGQIRYVCDTIKSIRR